MSITREMADRRGEGQALGNLGNAHRDLGEPRRAIEYYEQALDIMRELGDRRNEGHMWSNGAVAWDNLGARAKAIDWLLQALEIREAMKDPRVHQTRALLAKLTTEPNA